MGQLQWQKGAETVVVLMVTSRQKGLLIKLVDLDKKRRRRRKMKIYSPFVLSYTFHILKTTP